MNARTVPHEITRELYDLLMHALPYVRQASDRYYLGETREGQRSAAQLVDRIDASLAEAGDYITRGAA